MKTIIPADPDSGRRQITLTIYEGLPVAFFDHRLIKPTDQMPPNLWEDDKLDFLNGTFFTQANMVIACASHKFGLSKDHLVKEFLKDFC